MKYYWLPALLSTASGILFFSMYHEILVVQWPRSLSLATSLLSDGKTKRKITVYYWNGNIIKSETRDLLLPTNLAPSLAIVIRSWLTLLDEEQITVHKISLQATSIDPSGTELLISLDQLPFSIENSIYHKLFCIESLLRTVREYCDSITHVRLLVHHETPQDPHLDFTQSWSVHGYSVVNSEASLPMTRTECTTIMLDPAGDALYPGRCLGETFERTLTLLCAQKLKQFIELHDKRITVTITRSPGDIREPLQNAAFANRKNVNLYITIHCYQDNIPAPTLRLYYSRYKPLEDTWCYKSSTFELCPYNQAYRSSLGNTRYFVTMLEKSIIATSSRGFTFEGSYGIPFKPLQGIKVPALGCELGLTSDKELDILIEPIGKALIRCAHS